MPAIILPIERQALSRAKRQHGEWREQRLVLAAVRRRLRLLTAWRLVAGVQAEQKRLVHYRCADCSPKTKPRARNALSRRTTLFCPSSGPR